MEKLELELSKKENKKEITIGGSDIAAVMGLSRFKTPLELWAEKTGRLTKDKTEAMEIGLELEEYVARKFEKKTGLKLRKYKKTLQHKEYDYMRGHIDRLVLDGESIFEAKTASAWSVKKLEKEVPFEYLLQINWYLGLSGRSAGYLAVLIGGQKFIWKKLSFDRELFEREVEAAKFFWEEFIVRDTPPAAAAEDLETLSLLYPSSNSKRVFFEGETASEIDRLIIEREELLRQISEKKREADALEARLKQFLTDNEVGETENHRLLWKEVHRKAYTVSEANFRQFKVFKKGGE